MWKKQGSWNFFHAKLIPNSSNIYDDIFKQKHTTFPMLMIDTKQFPTKWRAKYLNLFYLPLTGHTDKELNYAIFHYFEKGKYVKSYKNSNDI